jgi:hypothetical protein
VACFLAEPGLSLRSEYLLRLRRIGGAGRSNRERKACLTAVIVAESGG